MKLIPYRTDTSEPGSPIFGFPNPVSGLYQLLFLILLNGCVTQFIPETEEEKELVVVEGLITDQPGPNTIKLSKSLPFGKKSEANPLTGCLVSLKDDLGNFYPLSEKKPGTYLTDSSAFRGQVGRFYTLGIAANNGTKIINYESFPVEMKPVPPIDSIYYEKTVIKEDFEGFFEIDGCNIYLDTHDPENSCKYYRWDFNETWVLRLLFPVENFKCWINDSSNEINFKSTAAFDESRIIRHPITYISNITDRLKTRYSISVNQYSLNEEEYVYWEKLHNITDQTGGLYDVIPASVPSNVFCIENPGERVLGYFSVSAKSSKRIFIKDKFSGIIDMYSDCITGTFYGDSEIPGLYTSVWVLADYPPGYYGFGSPRYRILTDNKGCADCTVRGTNVKPDFWVGD
jgi:hypothetical protein